MESKRYPVSPKCVRTDLTGSESCCTPGMNAKNLFLIMVVSSASAFAQTPGVGDTRPGVPGARDGSAPADGAIKGGSMDKSGPATDAARPATVPDTASARCHDLSGSLRDDCLREERERNAGAGATRAPEPATAPPPQNPR
jgi:hypothetical protein